MLLINPVVTVNYNGWKTADDKIDFSSVLTITPNQRYTKHTIQASKEIRRNLYRYCKAWRKLFYQKKATIKNGDI